MDAASPKPAVVPFSLKDAPALIERVWPAQKISIEAQKERKAGSGQTLTALGSYWKGRKPLILVRACLLGSLLPSTGDDALDIEIFETLMGMSEEQIGARLKGPLTVEDIAKYGTSAHRNLLLEQDAAGKDRLRSLERNAKTRATCEIIARMPYQMRVDRLLRPEECDESFLLGDRLQMVNRHLGTTARTLADLVHQLGVMRYGHTPIVADTFSGGGSIPFESARLGADVFACDLNPIACMLTWGALNVVGADDKRRDALSKKQVAVADIVAAKIANVGIDRDRDGNVAKAFLYCLETRCPETGWSIPLAPSWVISQNNRVIAKLNPVPQEKRFDLTIHSGVSAEEMAAAELGTMQKNRMVYVVEGQTYSTPIASIRGENSARLRKWERDDIEPRAEDVLQERLYCIQWITKSSKEKSRTETFFRAVEEEDIARERKAAKLVRENLAAWQRSGFIADMQIETGKENEGPIRTNGWTYWHHFFTPRQIVYHAYYAEASATLPEGRLIAAKMLDYCNKSSQWRPRGDYPEQLFSGPSLKTMFTWGARSAHSLRETMLTSFGAAQITGTATVANQAADANTPAADIYITDPPYADAVRYEEITEFFIAWLRNNQCQEFSDWKWDSRRALAIGGDNAQFKARMISAYAEMARRMPNNGLQIVMFTHQDASVWADMAQIFWGAGLQVMAAWYIATETTSELKKGGYVQGTVILILRKSTQSEAGYKDEIVQEIRAEVADQIDTMVGLNQRMTGLGRSENLFEDADLQMAGYAAALRTLTRYQKIDGQDLTKEALRVRKSDDPDIVSEVIQFAVQVANEHMVPDGMPRQLWERLSGAERFFFKMMDVETTSLRKLDNYQNFARAFRVSDYGSVMGSVEPNNARLKAAREFKKSGFEIPEFGPSATRAVLYAVFELENDVEGDEVLSHLRDMLPSYHSKRDDLAAIAEFIARKREKADETESRAARILHGLIRNERLG